MEMIVDSLLYDAEVDPLVCCTQVKPQLRKLADIRLYHNRVKRLYQDGKSFKGEAARTGEFYQEYSKS